MTESDAGGRAASGALAGFLVRRLAAARWFLLGLAAAVAVGAVLAPVPLPAALAFYAVVALLAALLPGGRAPPVPAADLPEPAASPSPETAAARFAEALPAPCVILDLRGVVRNANRRAAEVLGLRPGHPLTYRLRVPDLLAAFDRVARGGPPERVAYVERVPTERWYSAWFARLDVDPRAGQSILLLIDDLTEHRRIDRIRVDFVANASHELRTPLASLLGFIETLQGPARDDPAARERFLEIMRDQATRMSRLIDDLLSLSRIEMKAHVRPSDPVDLVAVVRQVADAIEPLARELAVRIETDLPDAPLVVAGDRDELFQVVQNLVENGCKYGQSGGRVVIRARPGEEGGGPSFSVRDFGPGVPEEHIPRLTERFYRADVSESRKHRGTGLGLAIVKHILARHQARLAIESRPGEGALFSVTFPPPSAVAPAGNVDNAHYLPSI